MSDLEKLQKSVGESLRREELLETEKWVEDNDEYYSKYNNEVIYSHTLLKAMKAVAQDLRNLSNKGKD